MAASQSRADLAEKKRKLDIAHIKDIWDCRMMIKHDNAKKVTPVAVDVALKGFTWEPQFKVPGHGTDVNI